MLNVETEPAPWVSAVSGEGGHVQRYVVKDFGEGGDVSELAGDVQRFGRSCERDGSGANEQLGGEGVT